MHKQRKNDCVLDANGHYYPFNDMTHGKNDYSWLMSPPEFPSLEVESQVPREKLVSQPLSRFAGKSEAIKAGNQSNWKPKFLARFSSPTGRSNVLLVGKKNNTSEQDTIQKMHQIASQINLENPRKDEVHSNKENPLFKGNLKPIIQLSRRPSFKDVTRNHDQERLNVSPILRKSSELTDQGPTNAQITSLTSRVPSSQAVTSDNKQETGPKFQQNSEFLDRGFTNIRAGRVSCSQSATRDRKHESKPKNPKFSDEVPPRDILTGRSSAHIPLTNNPEMVIKYSRKSSTPNVIGDCKPRNNTNVLLTIPPQNLNLSNPNHRNPKTGRSQPVSRVHSCAENKPGSLINKIEHATQRSRVSISSGNIKDGNQKSDPNELTIPPPKLQTGRSLSASRVHSSATNKPSFINKFEPVTRCSRELISSGVIKAGNHESDPNGLTIIPPLKLQRDRSHSVSPVHSNATNKPESFINKFKPLTQCSRVSISSVIKDCKHESAPNGLTKPPKLQIGRSLSASRVYSDSQISFSTRVSNIEQGSRTQVVGSKMVDKFLKARMQILEESLPKCRQNTSITKGQQSKTKFNTSIYDYSSFSKSICKTSLDRPLKHTELRRRDSSTFSMNSIMAGRRSVYI